ncbi:MAG: D-glycero-alpha-D-manno-heptose-1,7-bisphosphate 7-phosphatase [Planctomycetota bacterium]|jgi:D-glycero-D-manno-heptose 1,7-bisphosphate phosphatase
MKPAVFLDRDGTLIEHVHYLSDPRDVRLLPGAAGAVRELRANGYACVVVTNQSAIGRGMITVEDLDRIHAEMSRQLEAEGTELDGCWFSPAVPTGEDRTAVTDPDRKPGPGMILKAARELSLELGRSWMVGDMISDMLAGRNAKCRGCILVRSGAHRPSDETDIAVDHVVEDLAEAARLILRSDGAGREPRGGRS